MHRIRNSAVARKWGVLFALVAAFASAAALGVPGQPRVSFYTIAGAPVSIEQPSGKVTLVNFWATTCSVCMQEMPQLVQTYRALHARGFDVIAVAMPYDRPDWVLEYSQRKQLPFKIAVDPDGKINRAFGGIDATPTSFLIDAQGKILRRIVGAPDFAELRRAIESQLRR